MHQSLQGATFHVEHVVPRLRGGHSQLDNLAWACPSCNLHKANRTEVTDPDTGLQVPLFHPRVDDWQAHFVGRGIASLAKHPSAGRPLPHWL
jgi:HNH endonuclease